MLESSGFEVAIRDLAYASMADVLGDLKRVKDGLSPQGPRVAFSLARLVNNKKRQLTGLTAGCLLIFSGGLAWYWHSAGYELQPLWTFSLPELVRWHGAVMGEWERDGRPEILNHNGNRLITLSSKGRQGPPTTLEKLPGNPSDLGFMADVTGDGLEEIFVAWNQETNAHITAFNQRGWPIKDFAFRGTKGVDKEGGVDYTRLVPLRLADLDADGKPEINWFFPTAPFVLAVELIDMDGDGRLEILAGSNGPDNGVKLELIRWSCQRSRG